MVLHGITSEGCNYFQLFSLGEINWKLLHPYDVSYCNDIFLNRISSLDENLKLSISCHKVRILLIY